MMVISGKPGLGLGLKIDQAEEPETFLNQAHAGRRPACAWFLEITFVPPKYVCVCMCVCVSTPEAINN